MNHNTLNELRPAFKKGEACNYWMGMIFIAVATF